MALARSCRGTSYYVTSFNLHNFLIASFTLVYLLFPSQLFRVAKAARIQEYEKARSFTLDSMINVAHKYQGHTKTNCTKHQEECIAHTSIIAKEEGCLHQTTHIGSGIVVDAIGKHKNCCGATPQNRSAESQ